MSMTEVVRRAPQRFISSDAIETIAADVLAAAGELDDGYEVDIERVAEAMGCEVRYVQFTAQEVSARVFRGGRDPLRPYVIEVNASDSRPRRRFSLAHEVAHVVLHDTGEAGFEFVEYRKPLSDYPDTSGLYKEVQANMLAAALLMPQNVVTAYWRTNPDIDDLARAFGASRDSSYWRVSNLRLITDG